MNSLLSQLERLRLAVLMAVWALLLLARYAVYLIAGHGTVGDHVLLVSLWIVEALIAVVICIRAYDDRGNVLRYSSALLAIAAFATVGIAEPGAIRRVAVALFLVAGALATLLWLRSRDGARFRGHT
jgi:hypothetical protein